MLNDDDPVLDRTQASDYTGFSATTFPSWDSRKTYDLKPELRGRKIVYRQSVLDDLALTIRRRKARKA